MKRTVFGLCLFLALAAHVHAADPIKAPGPPTHYQISPIERHPKILGQPKKQRPRVTPPPTDT